MNSQMQKQIVIGLLSGVLITVIVIILLGGKRDELAGLQAQNTALQAEVHKGIQLKANYERLKKEVEVQQRLIDELIKLMPTEADRAEIFYRIKKLADGAGIEQTSFKSEASSKQTYYTEYPSTFSFRAGFHFFGLFASLISGYEKIISIGDIQMKRDNGNGIYPVTVTCRVSAYVYNPEPPPSQAQAGAAKSSAETPKKGGEGE
jgi:type IV pilus assembly protein PilO